MSASKGGGIARVAFIGFGEVGRTLAPELRAAGVRDIAAYDIAFAAPSSRTLRAAQDAGVRVAPDARAGASGADLVISAVTAGAALDAARSIAAALDRASFVLDVNSVAPATKIAAAGIVEAAGGRYVEAAVMAPIAPKRLRTPMLLGGPHADDFLAAASGWNLDARAYSQRVGAASSVKMCRSIMIKGLEALALECTLAAHRYDVLDDVLASLADTFPGQDMTARARYLISRALVHGRRRAEEMREVAVTVAGADCEPVMTDAIVARQDWAAGIGDALGPVRREEENLARLLADIDGLLRATTDEELKRCRVA